VKEQEEEIRRDHERREAKRQKQAVKEAEKPDPRTTGNRENLKEETRQ
jgi:hypothetical protein